MAVRHPNVGLDHPTVVPVDRRTTRETETHVVRCPACGRPLADH